jgi:hypothetical protein
MNFPEFCDAMMLSLVCDETIDSKRKRSRRVVSNCQNGKKNSSLNMRSEKHAFFEDAVIKRV